MRDMSYIAVNQNGADRQRQDGEQNIGLIHDLPQMIRDIINAAAGANKLWRNFNCVYPVTM